MATPTLDLSLLTVPDNTVRKQAEELLNHLQETNPALLANQLVETLANPSADPAVRGLSAVLLRRRLPGMFAMRTANEMPMLTDEWKTALKGKLGAPGALHAPLRRKICDTAGRIGVEMHAEGAWPELMGFVQGAAGEPTAHEAALSVLHMAPALVDPAGWARVGSHQALLVAALADGVLPRFSTRRSLRSRAFAACAAQEKEADSAAERKVQDCRG